MFTVSAHVILCIIFTFSNNILQTCIYRICKHEKAQIFASSLSNKKGIFSVFYIAFLEDNHHSTINYNKNKG